MLDLPASPVAREHADILEPNSMGRTADFSTPFIDVVSKTRDAVVNVQAQNETRAATSFDEYLRLFGLERPRASRSYGSGFIFRKDGFILTNNHVVAGASRISVLLSGEKEVQAKLVGTDPGTDLAVLRIDADDDLPYIPFGQSDDLRIGEWVVAIGNPFPELGLDRTVTAGVVSAKGRKNLRFAEGDVIYQDYIQTDATINPGNSGGPLLNLNGEAIGVNAAITSPSGGSVGIGFAIPIDYARAVVPDLIANGKVTRGWLGISDLRDIPQEIANDLHLTTPAVIFDKVINGSPAAQAGLKPRDVITHYNGKTFDDVNDFRFKIASSSIDETVKLDIIRNGEPMSLKVEIGDRSRALQAIQSERQIPYVEDYWLGMAVADCTPELAYRLGVSYPGDGGVIVTEVVPGSPAYNRNIVPGVIIIEIDKYKITDINAYREAVSTLRDSKKSISLIIYDTEGNTRWVGLSTGR